MCTTNTVLSCVTLRTVLIMVTTSRFPIVDSALEISRHTPRYLPTGNYCSLEQVPFHAPPSFTPKITNPFALATTDVQYVNRQEIVPRLSSEKKQFRCFLCMYSCVRPSGHLWWIQHTLRLALARWCLGDVRYRLGASAVALCLLISHLV